MSGVIHLKKGWLNHLWFLEALVLCYIVFPLIQYLYFGRKKWFYILFIVLWIGTIGRTLLVYGLNYFHGMGNDSLWLLCQLSRQRGVYFIYTLSYFCLGGILHRYSIRGENRKVRILWFLVLVIAMFIQYIYGVDRITSKGQGYDIVWEGYNTVPTFLMVLALYEMTITITGNNIISRWICYIGRNTLGIYFLHRCFIILGNLLVGEEIGQLFVVQIGLAIASIVLSLFIVFLMNKNVWTKQLVSLQS